MIKLLSIIFIFFSNIAFSKELVCNIDKPTIPRNGNAQSTKIYLNNWISEINRHLISINKIEFININKSKYLKEDIYVGEVLKNNSEKIKWRYTFTNTLIDTLNPIFDRARRPDTLFHLEFEYRKKSKVVFLDAFIDRAFRGLLGGIGKCEIKETSASTSSIIETINAEKAKGEKDRQLNLELKKIEAEKLRLKKIEENRLKLEKAEKLRLKKIEENRLKLENELKEKENIKKYRSESDNFYQDIENYVKSGGKVDLLKLSNYFDTRPNPAINWGKAELSRYERLRDYMLSIPEFVYYENENIKKRFILNIQKKDDVIKKLNRNKNLLISLMRKKFGSSEVIKIKNIISEIESSLSNFNQSVAEELLNRSTTYISINSEKPKEIKSVTKIVSSLDNNWLKLENDLPIQQRQFCQLTDRFYDNLKVARKSKNEIKVNMVHKERQENLDALIPQGKINNWIFKVVKIDQVEDGSAAVVLGLQCRSFVGSGQTIDIKSGMSKRDQKQWRATIPYNDRRFRELAKLDQGQFVVGSGTMLEINAYKPGQKETFYASQQIGEHPLTKGLNLEGELFIADLSYIAALN